MHPHPHAPPPHRKRNLKGGSVSDENLSASQLRARHGIQSNDKKFGENGGADMTIPIVLVVLVVVGAAVYFLTQ